MHLQFFLHRLLSPRTHDLVLRQQKKREASDLLFTKQAAEYATALTRACKRLKMTPEEIKTLTVVERQLVGV